MTLRSLVSGLVLVVSIPFILSGADDALVLHDATPVRLRINRTLSSADAAVGDRIDFEVLDEVKSATPWLSLAVVVRWAR